MFRLFVDVYFGFDLLFWWWLVGFVWIVWCVSVCYVCFLGCLLCCVTDWDFRFVWCYFVSGCLLFWFIIVLLISIRVYVVRFDLVYGFGLVGLRLSLLYLYCFGVIALLSFWWVGVWVPICCFEFRRCRHLVMICLFGFNRMYSLDVWALLGVWFGLDAFLRSLWLVLIWLLYVT